MDHADHVRLIRAGVKGATDGPWLDLGAGMGAFTLALADLLGPGGRVVAVDRDAGDLSENARRVRAAYPATRLTTLAADFTRPMHLALEVAPAGLVLANALHFVARAEQVPVLRSLAGLLRPGGRCVIVEYDADQGNTWVPYPFTYPAWERMAADADLVGVRPLARVPSRFLGAIHSAVAERPG